MTTALSKKPKRPGALRRLGWLVYKAIRQWLSRLGRGKQKTAVFVAGNQRSGMNLLIDVLERSLETAIYDEREVRIIKELVARSWASTVVVKAVNWAHNIPERLDALAPAKAIWVVRHYDDVANAGMFSSPQSRAQDLMVKLSRGKAQGGWRTERMSDETYELVRSLVDYKMSKSSVAALQWLFRNRLYFERGLASDPRVLLVLHNDLATQPLPALRRACAFLDVELTPFMTKHVQPRPNAAPPLRNISPEIRRVCEALWQDFLRRAAAENGDQTPATDGDAAPLRSNDASGLPVVR